MRHSLLQYVFTFIILVCSQSVYAQTYMNHPPFIKWKQIETQHLQIVYPEGLDSVAQRTANLMNHVYTPVTKSLNVSPRKISFFIHNQGAISNGFVTPIQPMMAWYTTPMQDIQRLGSGDWFQTLAVHEYRHVTQFEKMNQGATKTAKLLWGASGAGVLGLISHPIWFAEGDAVMIETALTNGGRGRSPSFSAPVKAIVQEGLPHSYDRMYNGSFKYYYPNHYTLGYFMVTHGRRKYGQYFWSDMLDHVALRSYNPYRFSESLRTLTGDNITRFYNNTIEELKDIWDEMDKGRTYTPLNVVTPQKHTVYTNYKNPLVVNDSTVFVKKSGFDHTSQYILLCNGKEKKLFNRAPNSPISTNKKTLVWSETISDLRYGERSYSDIYTYDITTKKLKRLTHKAKLFSPAISPEGDKIVAVKYDESMECSLKIFDTQTGSELKTIPLKAGELARTPSWSADGKSIVCAISYSEENTFEKIDLDSQKRTVLYGPSTETIGKPKIRNNQLVFNSPETGIEAIHLIDLSSGEHNVIAQTKYGASNTTFSADGSTIYYENYTPYGYQIVQSSFDRDNFQSFSTIQKQAENYFEPVIAQEQGKSIFEDSIPNEEFAVKKYKPFTQLINPHSWLWFPENEGLTLNVISDDKLNHVSAFAGVTYNSNEMAYSESIGITYKRFFPILSLTAINGLRTGMVTFEDEDALFGTSGIYYHWEEQSIQGGIELPFNFSKSHRTTSLSLKFMGAYKQISNSDKYENTGYWQSIGTSVPLRGNIRFINAQRPAYRDLQPNWGQILNYNTEYYVPDESAFGAYQHSVSGTQFIPGVVPSHGIKLSAGYEWQENFGGYAAPSYLRFTRGHKGKGLDHIGNTSVSYAFPLLYPDVRLGGTLYFKRLWAEAFADYSTNLDKEINQEIYTSVGMDLNVDFHIFRWMFAPINMGMRTSYNFQEEEMVYQFIVFGTAF